jgi:anthranilate/para-aminobenzoate synthase component I
LHNFEEAFRSALDQLAQGSGTQANQIAQAVAGQMNNQPIKAYVSTRDLNTAGEFNRLTESSARL